MTESQAEFISSISRNIKEKESIIKSLTQIDGDVVVFSPYSGNKVMIDDINFIRQLKEITINHYTEQLSYLKAQLENL
jgi:co-chaperonin GroES (HSP10)